MEDYPLARVAHYLADLLPVGGLVAVDLAVLARWLGVMRAPFQSLERVGQQILAMAAKLPVAHLMFASTVDAHKLL